MTDFNTRSKLPRTESATLMWVEPSQRLVTWTLDSGAVYKRTVSYWVIDTLVGTTSLVEGSSSSLNAGEWFFDSSTKELFVRMSDDSNPQASFVVVTYRLFFSDMPTTLPYNLTSGGFEVPYEPLIDKVPSFDQEIDPDEFFGIALESDGKVDLNNGAGFFIPIYDRLFWENKNVEIFTYIPGTLYSEKKRLFRGEIISKGYVNANTASFNISDPLVKLDTAIPQSLFSLSDGTISDSIIGNPKRTVYGQVNGLRVQSIDQVVDGFTLTGTVSGTVNTANLTGVGTSFLAETSPGDTLVINIEGDDFELSVDVVVSDTLITLGEDIEKTFSGSNIKNRPEIPYRGENRVFHVAGHKLREPNTTVSEVVQPNRFRVADITDFEVNDTISIGSNTSKIKRISGNLLILFQNVDTPVSVSDVVTKNPIRGMFFNKQELLVNRDFTISNTSTECKITLNNLAEFNQTKDLSVKGTSISFTNTLRAVTGSGTSFSEDIKPRDWIKSDDLAHTTYYEVLSVQSDTALTLRTAYAGANNTGNANVKKVTYIGDESVVSVNCAGKENGSGQWVKTASDVIKDLMADIGITDINTASFTASDAEAPFKMSLALPLKPGENSPTFKDVIKLVNKSVFGAVIIDNEFNVRYDILTMERNTALEIKDDDLTLKTVRIDSKVDIKRKITSKYQHKDADRFTDKEAFSVAEFTNVFVDNLIGTKKEETNDIYLLEQGDAEIVNKRYGLFNSLSRSTIEFNVNLFYITLKVGDKIQLTLDDIYERFGQASYKSKIGYITKIEKSSQGAKIRISDFGNLFNRAATITENTALDFSSAPDSEKIINGYFVDNTTELPDSAATSDDEWGSNIIG